jgi:hypothetical protein
MIRNRFGKPEATLKRGRLTKGKHKTFTRIELKAVEHLARLGATNKHMAEYFEVHTTTVEEWIRDNRFFRSAIKKGRIEADMKVVNSLYKRATGYSYIEEEYSVVEIDGEAQPLSKMAHVKRTVKTLPPDVKAAIHWLKVRQRDIWSPVEQSTILHSGHVNHLHQKLQDIPVHELTPESQKMLFEITTKQLAGSNNVN